MAKVDPLFRPVPFDQLSESTKQVLASNGRQFGLDARGYYDYRGGVDASGYYGDSWNAATSLTPEEYAAAAAAGGGAAINKALAAKQAKASGSSGAGSSSSASSSSGSSLPTATYTATDGTKMPLLVLRQALY